MRGRRWRRLRNENGQSFVEFTIILPIALVLILGVVDLGKATSYWLDSSHLANEAARYAVVNSCPDGPPCAVPLVQQIKNQAETSQLQSDVQVCVKYLDPLPGVTPPDGDGSVGHRLQVTVKSTYNFLSFLHLAPITITGKSDMRIEQTNTGTGQCST